MNLDQKATKQQQQTTEQQKIHLKVCFTSPLLKGSQKEHTNTHILYICVTFARTYAYTTHICSEIIKFCKRKGSECGMRVRVRERIKYCKIL